MKCLHAGDVFPLTPADEHDGGIDGGVEKEPCEAISCVRSRNINITMRPPPVVTGISPAEGPPGTKVIIRGEHLGINAKDVTGMKLNIVNKVTREVSSKPRGKIPVSCNCRHT